VTKTATTGVGTEIGIAKAAVVRIAIVLEILLSPQIARGKTRGIVLKRRPRKEDGATPKKVTMNPVKEKPEIDQKVDLMKIVTAIGAKKA